MNKLSSAPKVRTGVRARISEPRTFSAKFKAMATAVGASVLAACALNPAFQSTGPEHDAGGGGRDTGADVRPDTPEADAGADVRPDVGEADAGEDATTDAGVDARGEDAGEDVAVDSRADVGEDATTDAGSDAGEDAEADATAADAGADGGEGDAAVPPPPCIDTDLDLVCDDDDLCDLDPVEDDADGDGCDDLNGDDACLGNFRTNADSDGDGMGDGFVLGPDGEEYACDPWPSCNPAADGALPDAEGRFPPQEIWCDRDDDGDGTPNQEDCSPLDPSVDCGDRGAGVGEWLRNRIRRLFRGKGSAVAEESRLA